MMTMVEQDMELRDILRNAVNIAVVGLSRDPEADSRLVAEYLRDVGYRIIPVNPNASELMDERCYPDLTSIPENVDMVNIFRRPEDVPPVVEDAILKGAKTVWMQTGIRNEAAAQKARSSGLHVVEDRCIMVEHRRLFGTKE